VSAKETSPSLAAIVASVDLSLAGFRGQTSPDGMMTVVFTDIVGSTEMMERLGERRWLELMHVHNRLVRDCVAEAGGEVVKSQGDGFMMVFASAAAAVGCAVELQRTLARHQAEHPDEPLPVRIGLHTGNIFRTEGDFLGRAVVLAARITGRAAGGEILVSSAVRRYTESLRHWRYERATELHLKGLSQPELVHALAWS
jgi:class 3 adenylate cyclase